MACPWDKITQPTFANQRRYEIPKGNKHHPSMNRSYSYYTRASSTSYSQLIIPIFIWKTLLSTTSTSVYSYPLKKTIHKSTLIVLSPFLETLPVLILLKKIILQVFSDCPLALGNSSTSIIDNAGLPFCHYLVTEITFSVVDL